ncbi:MAG: ABC transporter permease [Dysgonamonadaceae bacterium]|jgi:putative ABC transport system permease protein|nr:ABC transporter permease [Dysgonamonadaceae bacterium]
MFDFDNWVEIFDAIKKNKLRTFLSGFSITWGLFTFVVLLSAANGAQDGVVMSFGNRFVNKLFISGRLTSIPYQGFPEDRKINFDQDDYDMVNKKIPEKQYLSATIRKLVNVNYGQSNSIGNLYGIHPDFNLISGVKVIDDQGRLIRDIDVEEKRKVVIINKRLREVLFADEYPVDKNIIINKVSFKVVGVFEEASVANLERMYIPFSTAQLIFNGGWGLEGLSMATVGLNTNDKNEMFNKKLIADFGAIHQFDPEDGRAIYINSQMKEYLQAVGIFNAVTVFIWIVGLGTLFAGIVGVSNIMLITVRERTKEFGIRKALGAKPTSILSSIIMESVCITALFGYLGVFLGICANKLFSSFLVNNPNMSSLAIFENPNVDMNVALGAMTILIIAGVFAGYFPARLAVKISPVEAMRSE